MGRTFGAQKLGARVAMGSYLKEVWGALGPVVEWDTFLICGRLKISISMCSLYVHCRYCVGPM